MILQSPSFANPVYYYVGYQGEVFSLLPKKNHEFIQFFGCNQLFMKYGQGENYSIDLTMMRERMDMYLLNCLPPEEKEAKVKSTNNYHRFIRKRIFVPKKC